MNRLVRTVFWTLLPLAVPQALLVRRRAPRFPVAEGPMAGTVGRGPVRRLVGIGDSVIAGVGAGTTDRAVVARSAAGLARLLHCRVDWRALGIVGAGASQVRGDVLPAVPAGQVDFWLVSVGVNDVTSLRRTGRWRADLEALLTALAAHSPGSVTALLGLPPMGSFPLLPRPLRDLLGLRSAIFDRIGADVAARHGAVHGSYAASLEPEQFSADGYHPSARGHQDIADGIVPRMAEAGRARIGAVARRP